MKLGSVLKQIIQDKKKLVEESKNKISLEELISEMVINDLQEAKKAVILNKSGYSQNNPLETIPNIMEK